MQPIGHRTNDEMAGGRIGARRRACGRDGDQLFVYGSLVSTMHREPGALERRCLRWHGDRIGRATFCGVMYDAGAYPAAVPSNRRVHRVFGEIWRISNARRLLSVLDAYETMADPVPQYARKKVRVTCARAKCMPAARARGRLPRTAWTYLWIEGINGLPLVAGGRWTERRSIRHGASLFLALLPNG